MGLVQFRVTNQLRWWTPAPQVLWNSNVKTIACSHTQRDDFPCIWNLRWGTDRPMHVIRTVEVLCKFTDTCLTRMEPTVANTRVGTLIVATIYLQLIQNRYMFRSFTVLQCSHQGLSPCDFDLIPKMKEPLRGIRFRTVPGILQAVDRSIRTINTTGNAKGILRLPHRWQRVVHNAGDYTEGE